MTACRFETGALQGDRKVGSRQGILDRLTLQLLKKLIIALLLLKLSSKHLNHVWNVLLAGEQLIRIS